MQEQIEREAALELALRQAVRNDELVLHLQPVFDLATDRIMGAEALVRWERPATGSCRRTTSSPSQSARR